MQAAPLDVAHLQSWIGRTEISVDWITPQLLRGFRAMMDEEPGDPKEGEPVPQSLHWCLAPATVPMSKIGPDGHPARGGFLPPVPLPRRMWAGGRLWFQDPLRVGDRVERLSTVKNVTVKEGRTGTLCFVLVEHKLSSARGLALTEEHDIVYRGLDAPAAGVAPTTEGLPVPSLSRAINPSPVLLFRYSALTYNGHRIHYDRDYVTRVEGYPGLIVHGPLQATLLLDLAAKLKDGARPKHFSFRALSPLFDLAPFTANGAVTDGGAAELWTAGGKALHMRGQAEW